MLYVLHILRSAEKLYYSNKINSNNNNNKNTWLIINNIINPNIGIYVLIIIL